MNINQLCDSLLSKHDALCLEITGMRKQFSAQLSSLQTEITALAVEAEEDIDNAIVSLNSVTISINDTITSDVRSLMNSDSFQSFVPPSIRGKLDQYDKMSELPSVFANTLLGFTKDALYTTCRDAINSVAAGIAIGNVSIYNKLIQDSGIAGVFNDLDNVYSDLVVICGKAPSTCAEDGRTLLDLDSNNKFDTTYFSSWNMEAVAAQLNELKVALDAREVEIENLSFS